MATNDTYEKIAQDILPPSAKIIAQQSEQLTSFNSTAFIVLSGSLLILGIIVLFSMTYLIKNGKEPTEILKAYGIPLIIISAVLMAVSGFGVRDMSPVIGLLGTVAGYLLGRTDAEILKQQKTHEIVKAKTEDDPQKLNQKKADDT
ncbi:hypothetical protein BCS42_12550 [Crenothrix sp. D3]|nr:hypothetical protein BCS42_12550 [Crenothrix sp. D3]